MTETNPCATLAIGCSVIRREASALLKLADELGESFTMAVELLSETSGKVVVSGMGKSGHVGRKIAATLASTGKPAHFVHPAEASHGDLGMLASNDVVVLISNSGETPELANVIAHAKRFRIPLIGIAGKAGSTLMRQADVGIELPEVGEACENDIVPTNSTTMTLALGDALAIALMGKRGFTPASFRDYHPGGKLGARLSRVKDLMHDGTSMPLIDESASMPDALLIMTKKGFGVAGIVSSSGRLSGVITDGDLRRHMDGLLDNNVSNVMTREPLTVAPEALAEEALALMNERKVTCLFVVEPDGNGEAIGILHIHDCLRAGVL